MQTMKTAKVFGPLPLPPSSVSVLATSTGRRPGGSSPKESTSTEVAGGSKDSRFCQQFLGEANHISPEVPGSFLRLAATKNNIHSEEGSWGSADLGSFDRLQNKSSSGLPTPTTGCDDLVHLLRLYPRGYGKGTALVAP